MQEISPDVLSNLIEEIQAIVTEKVFDYRSSLIEMKHEIGSTILQNNCNGVAQLKAISSQTKIGFRTLQYCVTFAERYPVLDEAPLDKNMSWRKIQQELLTDGHKEEKQLPELAEIMRLIDTNKEVIAKTARISRNGINLLIPEDCI